MNALPTIRRIRPDDLPAVIDLFRDTVRRVNARDYSHEQVTTWAPDEVDPARWATILDPSRFAVVAESDGLLAGFADLEPDGHVDRFFVHADRQRSGVGRALMTALLAEAARLALPRVFSEVSITARPFFESQGFAVLAEQQVLVRGVTFTNYRMELLLKSST
ncbi:GNAT family N-acetyltransferase [Planctomyces sp. SH-PL62]|uniref:GNAT family N-acetyltransferase n=1 Tax=Planctomyces sp. SH-PL62 TaxID=1636152 RepID=UPI00078B7024|nr:GNAT family N-acetyltransferase [Planctomyces sp. SH-PL62]AMV37942.1 putative N-acetyltransferase YafP [Planctomyces sp. SH-PL62]